MERGGGPGSLLSGPARQGGHGSPQYLIIFGRGRR